MPHQIDFEAIPQPLEAPPSSTLSALPLTLLAQRGLPLPQSDAPWLPPTLSAWTALQTAKERLANLTGAASVLIWADRDVDGVCAGLLIVEVLHGLGYRPVLHVSDRHGVQQSEFIRLLKEHSPALLILCDTAWSGFYANDYAKYHELPVIHLDHHPLSAEQQHDPKNPPTDFVNPTHLAANHPLAGLTGAGIAFGLAMLLDPQPTSQALQRRLELVTVGLIADVAALKGALPALLRRGLLALRQTTSAGLLALCQRETLSSAHLTFDDITYSLIPLLNAFARLDDPRKIAQVLTTSDPGEALTLAVEAEALNNQRKLMTRQMLKAIRSELEGDSSLLNSPGLVFSNPQWEAGLLGAVAGQLAAEYLRPVALLIPQADGVVRGSVRGYGQYDMLAALESLQDLLLQFGGHPGAAGFSLVPDNLPMFPRRFNNALKTQQPDPQPPTLLPDVLWPLQQATLGVVQEVEELAPFGNGNPRPVLAERNLKMQRSAKLGRAQQHRRLTLRDSAGHDHSLLWWNSSHLPMPAGQIDLAYQAAPVFRDADWEVQLTLVGWQPTPGSQAKASERPEWLDCRAALNLDDLRTQEPELMIWAEGFKQSDSPGLPLSDLAPASALVIYTAPAHPSLLEKALEKVSPQRVYLHAALPPFDHPQQLAQAMAALLRVAMQQWEGQITLSQLAERTAHAPSTIRLGLEALGGYITITWETRQRLHVTRVDFPEKINHPAFEAAVNESLAYRRYLGRAALEALAQ